MSLVTPHLVVAAYFVTRVVADAGDDFSNNLFSDLAPSVSQLLFNIAVRMLTVCSSQPAGALRRAGHHAVYESIHGLG